MINSWVATGYYNLKHDRCNAVNNLDNRIYKNDTFIAYFNPCSPLPLVQVYIDNTCLVCVCDSGASRSLVSSTLAVSLWGQNILNQLNQDKNFRLKDVNDNFLDVLGYKSVTFLINKNSFCHDFIFYQSPNMELLLGNDFFKAQKIAIFPNTGLMFESEQILKIGNAQDAIFELFLTEEISLPPGTQQVCTVYIQISPQDPQISQLVNKYFVAHSEELEPAIEFSQLSVYFQYVMINAQLQTEILIVNNTSEMKYYRARQLVAHGEPIKQVCSVKEIQTDELSVQLYENLKDLDGVTVQMSESRIAIDIPDKSPICLDKINCHSGQEDDLNWLRDQHLKFNTIFSKDPWDVGTQRGSSVHFQVRSNATICQQRFSRVNPRIKNEADEIINMLLTRNLIQVSKSPWSSRVLFVEKGAEDAQIKGMDGVPGQKDFTKKRKLRLVVDFRFLNSRLKMLNTSWPCPLINEMLNELHAASYLSIVDLSQGFWHYKIGQESRKYTAFQYGDMNYEFLRLPQGLCISSKIMQYKVRTFILKYQLQGCTAYIDNVMIYAPTLSLYKQRLSDFFNACFMENYKLKLNKSHHFITSTFILFGFQIDLRTHTITPEPAKISTIMNLITPITKKKLKSFLGAICYFSPLIPHLQKILGPLHSITGSNSKFIWTEQCEESFLQAKKALAKVPILYLLRPDRQVHATTDAAAGQFIAYSLWQEDNVLKQLVPIKHNSHKLSESEKNLSQWEAEGLALIFCLGKEEALLSFNNMVYHTDAKSLTFINRFANSSSKISRWDILIRSFNMTIHFLPNTSGIIKVTDIFTRNSVKGGQRNKRIRNDDLKDFIQLDFKGIPNLQISDTMALIKKLQTYFEKCSLPADKINRIRSDFPCPPPQMSRVTMGPEIVKTAAGSLVAQVVTCTDPLNFEDRALTSLPTTRALSVPAINWDNEICQPIKVKEILSNYLCEMSVKNLIIAQEEDVWISKLDTNMHQRFFKYQGLVMQKKQLQNGIWVSQIVLPQNLAHDLITMYHSRLYVKHESVRKMKKHLDTLFHIRNYEQVAQNIVNKCKFCAYNKTYPNPHLSPGIKIMVNAPRQFVFIDICTVRSDSPLDSFLTILDAFSKLVLYIPINKDSNAQIIVDILFQHWVRYFNFPIALCTDGGKNVCNKFIGEIATIMNTKLVRISPANSQSNTCERYNLLGIQTLRIFAQNYKIDDQNFDMILSLCGQMVNQSIRDDGFSPFYLHYGTYPRKNSFLSFHSLTALKDMDKHVLDLTKCQNVCFILAKRMQDKIRQHDNATQLPHKYNVGDFVLLRKIKISGPRHGIKLKKVYHDEPFRIVRRYKTNVMLVPYSRRYFKNRIKNEGKITKNMAVIARISRLKPILNPLHMLNLTISEKILRDFDNTLKLMTPEIDALEIIPKPTRQCPDEIIRDFNPSIQILPDAESLQVDMTPAQHALATGVLPIEPGTKLKVHIPDDPTSIHDICVVQLKSIKPGHTDSTIADWTSSYDSTDVESSHIINKLIPRERQSWSATISSLDSSSDSIFHEGNNQAFTPPSMELSPPQSVDNETSFLDIMPDIVTTPPPQRAQDQSILSTKAKRSTKKSVNNSVREIQLPSGKSLIFTLNPKTDTIKNFKK